MRQIIQNYRIPISIFSLILVVALLGTSAWILLGQGSNTTPRTTTHKISATKTPTPRTTQDPNAVSPLLFGTNLGLFDSNDQVINSTQTRTLLQQLHTRIIRMPVRNSLSNETEIQAAQDIKSMGAIPLVVLHGPSTQTALAENSVIVKDMNSVFGKSIVYYEYGNEEDYFHGIGAIGYTSGWNNTVPQLKKLALNGHFIGPVNYQYSHSYLTAFLQNAQPRPDEISWHEYTCSKKQQPDTCLNNIDKWTTHISDARATMQTVLNTTLPIMITEWNYAPDLQIENTGQVLADGKHENTSFMTNWTTKALQTLAANRVFASMQYSCTNTAIPLVNVDNTITVQGSVFENAYQQMIIQHKQPAAVTTTGTGQNSTSSTGNSPTKFSFEDGTTDNWIGSGQGISTMQNSTMVAQDGTHSLQVTLSNASSADFPYVALNTDNTSSYPHGGQTISAYVYTDSTTTSVNAKIFVTDNGNQWHTGNTVQLAPNTWNNLIYTLPDTISSQPHQFGIQFNSTGSGGSVNVFIDNVAQ